MVFVVPLLISLSMMSSGRTHVAANGVTPFSLWLSITSLHIHAASSSPVHLSVGV